MNRPIRSSRIRRTGEIRVITRINLIALAMLLFRVVASAQSEMSPSQSATVTLKPDQIGLVKTAPKISTRVSFQEPIKEIICGDLYDPASGTGSFVIQRIDNDLFIKPVVAAGTSNMFVKTGGNPDRIYNFSLKIYPAEQAHLIVNVRYAGNDVALVKNTPRSSGQSVYPPSVPNLSLLTGQFGSTMGDTTVSGLSYTPPIRELVEPPPPPLSVKSKSISDPSDPKSKSDSVGVSRVMIQGPPIKTVGAEYPQRARKVNASGTVNVEIIVDEKGKVISAKAISGNMLLREPAVAAAQGWWFKPTEVDGVPTQAFGLITFTFERGNSRGVGSSGARRITEVGGNTRP